MEFWIVVFYFGNGRRDAIRNPQVFYVKEEAESYIEGHNHSARIMGLGPSAVLYHAIGIEV